jgi:hypothetical protein
MKDLFIGIDLGINKNKKNLSNLYFGREKSKNFSLSKIGVKIAKTFLEEKFLKD